MEERAGVAPELVFQNARQCLWEWEFPLAIRQLSLRTPRPTERDSSSGFLPTNLPLFPGGLQLPVPFRMDLVLPPRQLGPFQNDLNVRLGHRQSQIPVHDVSAATV